MSAQEILFKTMMFSLVAVLLFAVAGLVYSFFGIWKSGRELRQNQRKLKQEAEARQRQERDRTLYQLIQRNEGKVSLLQFAVESGLSAQEARAHLEICATEFGGVAEFSETGAMTYRFDLP